MTTLCKPISLRILPSCVENSIWISKSNLVNSLIIVEWGGWLIKYREIRVNQTRSYCVDGVGISLTKGIKTQQKYSQRCLEGSPLPTSVNTSEADSQRCLAAGTPGGLHPCLHARASGAHMELHGFVVPCHPSWRPPPHHAAFLHCCVSLYKWAKWILGFHHRNAGSLKKGLVCKCVRKMPTRL